jgi:hypothetical protein
VKAWFWRIAATASRKIAIRSTNKVCRRSSKLTVKNQHPPGTKRATIIRHGRRIAQAQFGVVARRRITPSAQSALRATEIAERFSAQCRSVISALIRRASCCAKAMIVRKRCRVRLRPKQPPAEFGWCQTVRREAV